MINPSNSYSLHSTFEERVEKIQDIISRFIVENKTGRSNIQVWELNEPSTSSGNAPKTARHHFIPGDTFRDVFMTTLSNQQSWPDMVQILNAALENYDCHGSRKINIPNAKCALNLLDARIPDSECNIDTFYESLEDLYAIFYWTPFNIYYGPLPHMRAPADAGNKLDTALAPGVDFLTFISTQLLQDMFKNLEISNITVKLYIMLLLTYPTPITRFYKEIQPTFDHVLKNYVQHELKMEPNTEEFDRKVMETKSDGNLLSYLSLSWIHTLSVIGACDKCVKNAIDSIESTSYQSTAIETYKCREKKCPFFTAQKKYNLHSHVRAESFLSIAELLVQAVYYLLVEKKVPLQRIREKLGKLNAETLANSFSGDEIYAKLYKFIFLTENLDYEYIKIKDKIDSTNLLTK